MEKNQLLRKPLLLATSLLFSALCSSQVSLQWLARYNGPTNASDVAAAMTIDHAGNVYVTGLTQVSGANRDYATIKYDPNGVQLWVRTYNGTGNRHDEANDIAVDALGNVYVTGQSEGPSIFNFDYATVKYDADGNELWVARYEGPGASTDIASSIAVDAAGDVYITGSSYGSASNTDYATIKYASNGTLLWVSRYDGPGAGNDGANDLILDNAANVYITGYSRGIGTDADYATIKYNSAGTVQWVSRYNGPANDLDQAFALTLDLAGNVYVTGQSFEIPPGTAYATVKYDATGLQLWASRYHGGTGSDLARAIAVDATGNVFVTGSSNLDDSDQGDDYLTIKYNSLGLELWTARYDGPDHDIDRAHAIAVDDAGNIYVTGMSSNVHDFMSEGDYATIKYNTLGVQQWVQRYDGPGHTTDIAYDIEVDDAGNVHITGFSNGDGTEADYATIKYSQAVAACGNDGDKVVICHNGRTLCVSPGAAAAHIRHGDPAGPCPEAVMVTTKSKDAAGQLPALNGSGVHIYPNPVSTNATMQIDLPFEGQVSVHVYDVLGRQVSAVAGTRRKAGSYTSTFDVSTLRNGVYYYKIELRSGSRVWMQTRKITVAR